MTMQILEVRITRTLIYSWCQCTELLWNTLYGEVEDSPKSQQFHHIVYRNVCLCIHQESCIKMQMAALFIVYKLTPSQMSINSIFI